MDRAARRLQAFWRSCVSRARGWSFFARQFEAAAMIQKNWKITKWCRVINRAAKSRRLEAAVRVQSILRGYLVRKDILEVAVARHLVTNFQFFDKMREQIVEDSQVTVAYHWRKTAKKIKAKLEKDEKEKQRKLELERQKAEDRRQTQIRMTQPTASSRRGQHARDSSNRELFKEKVKETNSSHHTPAGPNSPVHATRHKESNDTIGSGHSSSKGGD